MIWIDSREAECLPDISVPKESVLQWLTILTHLGDGTAEGDVSVLSVHVDGFCSAQVSNNETVVFD